MSPQDQHIAIAKACGKTVIECPFIPNQINHRNDNTYFTQEALREFVATYRHAALAKSLPDYSYNLNAMHEAERLLPCGLWTRYCQYLCEFGGGSVRFVAVHSTAAHRAKAFLKTLNLWKES